MDDLTTLREIIANEAAHDAEAREAVWRRVGTPHEHRHWSQPRFLIFGGIAVAAALAIVMLTLRSSSIGVTAANAACRASAPPARCARALATLLWPSQSPTTRTRPPRIAFSLFRGPTGAGIYTMNNRGGDLRRLTDGPGMAAFPTWSPDGTHIAFNWQ